MHCQNSSPGTCFVILLSVSKTNLLILMAQRHVQNVYKSITRLQCVSACGLNFTHNTCLFDTVCFDSSSDTINCSNVTGSSTNCLKNTEHLFSSVFQSCLHALKLGKI